jgi:hypothetical protein
MPSDCRYENSGYDNQHLSNDFTQELRGQDKARTQLHTQRLKTAGRSNKKHRGGRFRQLFNLVHFRY